MENFYVYVYLDPRKPGNYNYGEYHFDYEPFYIGKGNNGRAYRHLTGKGYNKHLNNKIRKIQNEKYIPIIIKYKECLLENDSFILEINMINTIGRHDLYTGPLCNHTNGGEGSSGHKCSEEIKKYWSKIRKGVEPPNKGKTGIYSQETLKKISENSKIKSRKHHIAIEITALNLIDMGYNNKEIGNILQISPNTVQYWYYKKITNYKSRSKYMIFTGGNNSE